MTGILRQNAHKKIKFRKLVSSIDMRCAHFWPWFCLYLLYIFVMGGVVLSALEKDQKSTEPERWNYWNSTYVMFTAASTIGYGLQAPETQGGRLYLVFFSLLGIPLHASVVVAIGGFVSRFVNFLLSKEVKPEKRHRWNVLIGCILACLGFVVLIFLPTVTFQAIEGWTMKEGLYYCYITLSTIGFGDLHSGEGGVRPSNNYTQDIVLYIWIITGMAYIVVIFDLVTDRTKRFVRTGLRRLRRQNVKLEQQFEDTVEENMEDVVKEWMAKIATRQCTCYNNSCRSCNGISGLLKNSKQSDIQDLIKVLSCESVRQQAKFAREILGMAQPEEYKTLEKIEKRLDEPKDAKTKKEKVAHKDTRTTFLAKEEANVEPRLFGKESVGRLLDRFLTWVAGGGKDRKKESNGPIEVVQTAPKSSTTKDTEPRRDIP